MSTNHKAELDKLYDFLSKYYLDTSMLIIPHKYRKYLSNDSLEVGAVAFLSAIYDFKMQVSLIISRFLYILDYLNKKNFEYLIY